MSQTARGQSLAIDLVFPRFKLLSGAERLVLEMAASLARAGHRPRIVCHQFDDSCRPLLAEGVRLHATGVRIDWFRNRYLNAALDYARVPALRRALYAAADITVLYGPAVRLGPWLRRRGRTTVVYHCFEPPRVLYQDRADVLARAGVLRWVLAPALMLYRRNDRHLVATPHVVTTAGPFAVRRFHEVYGREAVSLAHGIDRDSLDATAKKGVESTTLVTVNYLHPRKRVDLAIRALAELKDPLPGDVSAPTLGIVGDGPEREALEGLALRLGVRDRVRFAGFVPEHELGAHYRAARVYVHMTREETFGLAAIEAAHCRLPVVAVAEGGVLDNIVDGLTGRLVEATPAALAEGVREVLSDPERARRMGAEARASVARHTWDQGAADLLSAARVAR